MVPGSAHQDGICPQAVSTWALVLSFNPSASQSWVSSSVQGGGDLVTLGC